MEQMVMVGLIWGTQETQMKWHLLVAMKPNGSIHLNDGNVWQRHKSFQ